MIILLLPQALGITIRHDADDAEYTALAESFPAVGHIDGCTATLIAPDVVLTAAHCFDDDGDGELDAGRMPDGFFLGPSWDAVSAEHAIDDFVLHPERTPTSRERWDVALIFLSEPIDDIAPIPVSDADPVGERVVIVGYGGTGTGLDADYWSDAAYDGLKRAAQNTVDGRDEETFGTGVLILDFDAPDGSTNSSVDVYGLDSLDSPLELEGCTGPGDSGGPMLMPVDGQWRVVGVASAGFNPLSQTQDDERAGQYGSIGEHASLSLDETVDFLAQVGWTGDSDAGEEPGDTGEAGGEKAGGCMTAAAPLGSWVLLLPALWAGRRSRLSG
jgi:V8-like Glu-specific endopeptidase